MEVIAILQLGDANSYYHLRPISLCNIVDTLWIVRPASRNERLSFPKARYIEVAGRSKLGKLFRILQQSIELGKRHQVRAFVSFTALPYGLIALLAGIWCQKPVHIGFIGSDWYRDCKAWFGGWINWLFRKADVITVPGERMRQDMIANGYHPERIHHLPHGIDIDEYDNIAPDERTYDCLFVGRLISLKRVDLILDAINRVKTTRPGVSLCIVGDGPLREELEAQAKRLGLGGNITFTGFKPRPAGYFANARIILIASDREGFPFTLVEGMAAGAVPVSTDVGTINEFIHHGVNGLLVLPNNAEQLAQGISSLLSDTMLYKRLRSNVIAKRGEFSFDQVVPTWTGLLNKMVHEDVVS